MSCKIRVMFVFSVLGTMVLAGYGAGPRKMSKNRIRFEHIALNVDNSVKVAHWYRDNLGMKIIRGGDAPGSRQFISDAGGNMMFEFYNSELAKVPDYESMHKHELHIAFMVDDVEAACRRLINAGARMDGEIVTTEEGDKIAIVRDPWGIPIQFVNRAKPMLHHN